MLNNRISVLSQDLCNQIAAGEVVERPASIVKELVENSLDAWSTSVDVTIENGGQALIRVQDNGIGIHKDDLALSVTRHATSKISTVHDLENIHSYGFRGEALPSIASVSRCTLTSTESNSQEGSWSLAIDFGKLAPLQPASLHRGTIIEVRDLFENVPARLKFLRGKVTEVRRCQEWLTKIALARLDVAFCLTSDGRELLRFLPQESLLERVGKIWPKLIADSLIAFDFSQHGIRVHGLAAKPQVNQAKGNRQYLYVNGRSISDKNILGAIHEAYKGCLTSREYPQVVLFIEIDPYDVDVNVHPAKSEVRFKDKKLVFKVVLNGLRAALLKSEYNIDVQLEGHASVPVQRNMPCQEEGTATLQETALPWEQDFVPQAQERQISQDYQPKTAMVSGASSWQHAPTTPSAWQNQTETTATLDGSDFSWLQNAREKQLAQETPLSTQGTSLPTQEMPVPSQGTLLPQEQEELQSSWGEAQDVTEEEQLPRTRFHYLGQIAQTYLVLTDVSGSLWLLDQHAAHERIIYNQISERGYRGRGQRLAISLDFVLQESEKERWFDLKEHLSRLGFAGTLTNDTLTIRSIPTILAREEAKAFLTDALASRKDDFEDKLIMMACKSAVKAGHLLSHEEALRLIEQWSVTPHKEFCPHGRPAILHWSNQDLEKLFKRRI